MNITYLIGNGFDLHFGLKTSYSKFYDYYVNQRSANKQVERLKKKCLKRKELWSDLESALGEFTEATDCRDDYIFFIKDIQIALAKFCQEQQQNVVIDEIKRVKVREDIVFFDPYFIDERVKGEIFKIKPRSEQYIVNFIVFNYTNTLETILQYPQTRSITGWFDGRPFGDRYEAMSGELIHIHGTTERFMVLGINDATQIYNKKFAGSEKFLREIIKPLMNENSLTHRAEQAIRQIKTADIICIYGMSIGNTDKLWWETIGTHLKESRAYLFIFDIPQEDHFTRGFLGSQIEEKKELFLEKTALNEADKALIRDRIFICLTNDMF